LGITEIDAAIIDLRGNILAQHSLPTRREEGQASVLHRMKGLANQLLQEIERDKIIGLGIGVPGLVDHPSGVNLFSPNLGWRDVPIREIFQNEFALPVVVENNARAMALGEGWYGIARGHENFVWIHVGTGVGAGIVLNGELYRGDAGSAGEIGHTTVDPHGPLCQCGNRGCLEVLCSGPSIARRAIEALTKGTPSVLTQHNGNLQAEMVSAAASAGDELAKRILHEAGVWLGTGIANLSETLNVSLVILGGGVIKAGEPFLHAVLEAANSRLRTMPLYQPDIRVSALEPNAGAIGAATLVFQRLLQSPVDFMRQRRSFQHIEEAGTTK